METSPRRWLVALEADDRKTLTWWVVVVAAIMALTGALAVLVSQVEVTDSELAVTRACGSALDGAIDRSGWEVWWAQDLDEPVEEVRLGLVRTEHCPDAVNRRIATASLLAVIGAVLVLFAARSSCDSGTQRTRSENDLSRLGRATSWTGAVLTIAGAVAIFVLVADADSTLFLYTDRLVVAIVGLIVLIPTIVLFVLGRALQALGERAASSGRSEEMTAAREPAESDA